MNSIKLIWYKNIRKEIIVMRKTIEKIRFRMPSKPPKVEKPKKGKGSYNRKNKHKKGP